MLGPELRLEQEYSTFCPDKVHVHLLRDEDLPIEQGLVVQRTGRHGPTRDPHSQSKTLFNLSRSNTFLMQAITSVSGAVRSSSSVRQDPGNKDRNCSLSVDAMAPLLTAAARSGTENGGYGHKPVGSTRS